MSSKKLHKVYVYGTLRPKTGDTIEIPGAVIYDLGWYPGLKFVDDPNCIVVGQVIEADDDRLRQLDRYEGYDEENPERSLYIRQEYRDGWIYVYNNGVDGHPPIISGDWKDYSTKHRLQEA